MSFTDEEILDALKEAHSGNTVRDFLGDSDDAAGVITDESEHCARWAIHKLWDEVSALPEAFGDADAGPLLAKHMHKATRLAMTLGLVAGANLERKAQPIADVVDKARGVVECWESSGDSVTGARELRTALEKYDAATRADAPSKV